MPIVLYTMRSPTFERVQEAEVLQQENTLIPSAEI